MEALIIAGTAISALGSIQQGKSAQSAANANADNLEQNAAIERSQANQREEAKRREARMILGNQRAGFAQAGGGMGGSAADVMRQSSINAELDALTLRYEGDLRARGMQAEAQQERFAGKVAKRAGYFNAASSILSGAAAYGAYGENKKFREAQLKRMI
jgi:hypothetical protein